MRLDLASARAALATGWVPNIFDVLFVVMGAFVAAYVALLVGALAATARRLRGRAPWSALPVALALAALVVDLVMEPLFNLGRVFPGSLGPTRLLPIAVASVAAGGWAGVARPRLRAAAWAVAVVAGGATLLGLWELARRIDEAPPGGARGGEPAACFRCVSARPSHG